MSAKNKARFSQSPKGWRKIDATTTTAYHITKELAAAEFKRLKKPAKKADKAAEDA